MKVLVLLSLSFLTACATNPAAGLYTEQRERNGTGLLPSSPSIGFQTVGHPNDAFTLIDSRTIRALRRIERDVPALGLTREQKLALWIGVGIVAAYLVTEWIEDEVAFFP